MPSFLSYMNSLEKGLHFILAGAPNLPFATDFLGRPLSLKTNSVVFFDSCSMWPRFHFSIFCVDSESCAGLPSWGFSNIPSSAQCLSGVLRNSICVVFPMLPLAKRSMPVCEDKALLSPFKETYLYIFISKDSLTSLRTQHCTVSAPDTHLLSVLLA